MSIHLQEDRWQRLQVLPTTVDGRAALQNLERAQDLSQQAAANDAEPVARVAA
ncbi:MAG: hypothetical protein RKP20_11305 [Candidatus Competibacter sp.]|nr:hypothetical protein [Candidatus Competibacter sp.]